MKAYFILVSCTAPSNSLETILRTSFLALNTRIAGEDAPAIITERFKRQMMRYDGGYSAMLEETNTDYGHRFTIGKCLEIQLHEIKGEVKRIDSNIRFVNYKLLKH